MSWFSNIWDGVKKVGSTIGGIAKKVITPVASFAAGLVPGIGPLLSQGVDIIGNKLLGDEADASMDAGQQSATPVSDLMGQLTGRPMTLGASPAAQAMSAATAPAADTSSSFLGNGKGFLGIGDGKPGVLGIGTGKAKAKKAAQKAAEEAAEVARAQAEDAARGEGLESREVKLAGQQAYDKAEKKVLKQLDATDDDSSSSEKGGLGWLIGAAAALLLLG